MFLTRVEMAKNKKKKLESNLNIDSTSKTQLELLKKRYGDSLNDVDVTLPMTYNEVLNYFGKQCEEFNPQCGCCRAWVQWNTTGQKVTISLDRDVVLKVLKEEGY